MCPTLAYIRICLILFELVGKRKAPDGNQGLYRLSERRGSNSRHPPWQGGALPSIKLCLRYPKECLFCHFYRILLYQEKALLLLLKK